MGGAIRRALHRSVYGKWRWLGRECRDIGLRAAHDVDRRGTGMDSLPRLDHRDVHLEQRGRRFRTPPDDGDSQASRHGLVVRRLGKLRRRTWRRASPWRLQRHLVRDALRNRRESRSNLHADHHPRCQLDRGARRPIARGWSRLRRLLSGHLDTGCAQYFRRHQSQLDEERVNRAAPDGHSDRQRLHAQDGNVRVLPRGRTTRA